jgi:hypothetical protein
MKGDFSRLTFRPRQHYARVLQQQGRPQLDADWNEQVAILLHRLAMLTGDLTGGADGRSGGPFGAAGFEIGPMPGEADNFTIGRGRYYVDGLCCECDEDTTYVQQPLPTGVKPDRDGISLVYLDVWEAVVGPLDDPALLEPALSGRDTTLRTRAAWQVRTHRLSPHHDPRKPDLVALRTEGLEVPGAWHAQRRGLLRIRLAGQPAERGRRHHSGEGSGAHFRGLENLLYRVEVHDGGPVGAASFKWSRDNGATLLPLASLEATVAQVASVARQAASAMTPGTWVELSDSLDRVLGRCRPMVQVVSADASGRIELSGSPGGGLSFKPGERSDVALRRWDQRSAGTPGGVSAGANGVTIVEGDHEAHWLDIEDGIQVQFHAAREPAHHYRTGDYWLVPARTADEGILLRSQAPQPPDGIEHHYTPLALFVPQAGEVIADFRQTFQPLSALQDLVGMLSEGVEELRQRVAALERK